VTVSIRLWSKHLIEDHDTRTRVYATKAELTVQMLDPLIRELAALFAEVNVIEDPDTRRNVWATKADAIVETYALA
jgi:hypothetical protein